jgi:uncharacterized membrane protein
MATDRLKVGRLIMKIFALIVALSSFAVSARYCNSNTPARQRTTLKSNGTNRKPKPSRARIGILNRADACIKAAKTPQDYKACETQEKQERQALRDKIKPQKEAIHAEAKQQRQARAAQQKQRKGVTPC